MTEPPTLGQRVLRPREQVEEALQEAVLKGRLKAGDRLPAEAELARQFSVSRPTIREALSALQTKGLIRKVPGMHGGSFVQAVDHKALGEVVQESMHNLLKLGSVDFDEVALVREYLEVPSVRLAAVHRTEADVVQLRNIVEEQKARSVEDPAVPELDAQFHTAIAAMSGNRVLGSLVYALHRETEPVHHLNLSADVGRRTVRQHQRIIDAIADQDPDEGAAAIREHLAYLRKHVRHDSIPSRAPAPS